MTGSLQLREYPGEIVRFKRWNVLIVSSVPIKMRLGKFGTGLA
jgi:hypothetical protein